MRKAGYSLAILALLLPILAGQALAAEKPLATKPAAETQRGMLREIETEPNDDCAQADGPIAAGDTYIALIDPGGDQDWYAFEAVGGECMVFETHPVDLEIDTELYLVGEDCDILNYIKFDDNGGHEFFSRIQHTFPAAGTFYVVVTGALAVTIGYYTLTAEACENPIDNDTCESAIDLREQGLDLFYVDLCRAADDYSPGGYGNPCTGWAANGEDVVYEIYLHEGDEFAALETPDGGYLDCSLYLVTDCDDIWGSCVAGSDSGNPETISYTAENEGLYYLIVDAYSGCAMVRVEVELPVATGIAYPAEYKMQSWSTLKSMYR